MLRRIIVKSKIIFWTAMCLALYTMLRGADAKLECEQKILGSLLNTQHSVLPFDLRNKVALFATPQSTPDCPVDFLLNSIIIPKEFGTVCDIYRDNVTKKVKLLMCRYSCPQDTMLRTIRKFALYSSVLSLACLGIGSMLDTNIAPFDHDMSLQKSLGVGLVAGASYVKDIFYSCLGRKHLGSVEFLT